MKIVKVEAGYAYETQDKKYYIYKTWERRRQYKCKYPTLDSYRKEAFWNVFGDGQIIRMFSKLADAKAYVKSLY